MISADMQSTHCYLHKWQHMALEHAGANVRQVSWTLLDHLRCTLCGQRYSC